MEKIITRMMQTKERATLKIIGYSIIVLLLFATASFFGYWTYHDMRYKVLVVGQLRIPVIYDAWANEFNTIPASKSLKR